MKRILVAVVAVLMLAVSGVAMAQTSEPGPGHYNGALGFRHLAAPLGFRWWLPNQVWAIDAGIGFGSEPAGVGDEKLTHWAIDLGVPYRVASWDRVHLLLRP